LDFFQHQFIRPSGAPEGLLFLAFAALHAAEIGRPKGAFRGVAPPAG
jgi:hypothetical protein